MQSTSHAFKDNAHGALADERLQKALGKMKVGFQDKRTRAVARLPEFETLQDQSRDIKNHVLDHLDLYLERFENNVIANGGKVHWCRTTGEAREGPRTSRFSSGDSTSGTPHRWAAVKFHVGALIAPGAYQLGEM